MNNSIKGMNRIHKTYIVPFFGERILFKTNFPDLVESLHGFTLLPFKAVKDSQLRNGIKGISGEVTIITEEPEGLISDMNFPGYAHEFITQLALAVNHRFLFIHSCAMVSNDKAVAFCGKSGSGKTTLAMLAHYFGYRVLAEDLLVVDWKQGKGYPLRLPYRPRPLARKIFQNWLISDETAGKKNFPAHRPAGSRHGVNLHYFLFAGEMTTYIQAAAGAVLGANRMEPKKLIMQITRAVQNCKIMQCPVIDIKPTIGKEKMAVVFKKWIESDMKTFPGQIFGGK